MGPSGSHDTFPTELLSLASQSAVVAAELPIGVDLLRRAPQQGLRRGGRRNQCLRDVVHQRDVRHAALSDPP